MPRYELKRHTYINNNLFAATHTGRVFDRNAAILDFVSCSFMGLWFDRGIHIVATKIGTYSYFPMKRFYYQVPHFIFKVPNFCSHVKYILFIKLGSN